MVVYKKLSRFVMKNTNYYHLRDVISLIQGDQEEGDTSIINYRILFLQVTTKYNS